MAAMGVGVINEQLSDERPSDEPRSSSAGKPTPDSR
jgi:hypothetical protein